MMNATHTIVVAIATLTVSFPTATIVSHDLD
jgi:hypothetical protein